ncbi:MAG: acryloyl-CoA reductase [Thermaerobacter sp.]|nr:acryloyl-CoA reductase [Thermaerobacter sp.]
MRDTFQSLWVDRDQDQFHCGFKETAFDDLSKGELLVRVAYSSVNYKDGLASIPSGNVVRRYPLIPGIDLAGTVVSSSDSRFCEGDSILATGYDLGVSHHGGFAEYARIPADWAVPIPPGLDPKQAMSLGTAALTAALAIHRLEANGLRPGKGSVLVTGATGGVGSLAVAMLAGRGYEVEASTGKESEHGFLRALGAATVLRREDVSPQTLRPLDRQRWAAAIDPVGGQTLAYILTSLLYGGSVALVGLTGGGSFQGTVFPFIIRGGNLLGIDSAYLDMETRRLLWEQLAAELKPPQLGELAQEISFADLPAALARILEGGVRGRIVVRVAN